jgi:hypothetical protein
MNALKLNWLGFGPPPLFHIETSFTCKMQDGDIDIMQCMFNKKLPNVYKEFNPIWIVLKCVAI